MLIAAEEKLMGNILPHRGMVAEVSGSIGPGDEWMRGVIALRPTLQGHRFQERGSASQPGVEMHPLEEITAHGALDAFLEKSPVRRLSCLRVEPLALAARIVAEMPASITKRRIDSLRVTYRAADAWEHFATVFEKMTKAGYAMVRLAEPSGRITGLTPANKASQQGEYLALSPRFLPDPVTGSGELDMRGLLRKYGIAPRGVVHVGAHNCQELPLYKSLGVPRILFIEANPEICEKIRQENARDPAVRIENLAISDVDGSLTLHITSESQSSSILPLKHHKHYYPEIHQTRDVTVPAKRLETLFGELGLNPADYNYLHLDIQGAELLALKGAIPLLPHFDVVSTELNFDEMYEGCALAEDMEDFLEAHDFHLATVICSCSSSWGDSLFVKGRFLRPAPNAGGARGVTVLGKTATGGHIVSFGGPR